jgi:hypothetical protein
MPEYNCDCCGFKTRDKGKYLKHNETNKHLTNMNSFEPKVDLLEQIMKRLDVLEKRLDVLKQDVEEPVEPFDLDILIYDLIQKNEISKEQYGYYDEIQERDTIDMTKYVNDHFSKEEQIDMAEGNLDEMLLQSYKEGIVKAIYNKLCKVIPSGSMKVNDLSRSKYSIYCEGSWLNHINSAEKLEEIVNLYQSNMQKLHSIYMTCMELHNVELKHEEFNNMLTNLCQGKDVIYKVIKQLLGYFKQTDKIDLKK